MGAVDDSQATATRPECWTWACWPPGLALERAVTLVTAFLRPTWGWSESRGEVRSRDPQVDLEVQHGSWSRQELTVSACQSVVGTVSVPATDPTDNTLFEPVAQEAWCDHI